MLTAQQLARSKQAAPVEFPASMGSYDHQEQRRWVGDDASLIQWSMKSDTAFDGESKDPD